MDEINAQEEVQIQFSRSFHNNRSDNRWPNRIRKNKQGFSPPAPGNKGKAKSNRRTCIICKAAGRPFEGHDIENCWFISKFDKLEASKALRVAVDGDESDSECNEEETEQPES